MCLCIEAVIGTAHLTLWTLTYCGGSVCVWTKSFVLEIKNIYIYWVVKTGIYPG